MVNVRHTALLGQLGEHGERTVAQLVSSLGVSDMTVRRDLAALERAGRVQRTWGGARLAERQLLDISFGAKARRFGKEKQAIGEAAAALVTEGATVVIDTGTTALQVARALRSRTGVRVLTCSLPIVAELLDCPGITTEMIGGTVRADSLEVYGPLTERNFAGLRADIAFLGADAVDGNGGLYTVGMETARVAELMLQISARKVLVADASKWDTSASVRYAEVSALSAVVSDKRLSKKRRQDVAGRGVELIVS